VNVDFTSKSGAGIDRLGHGTHIAGIIASNATYAGDITGVAPGARIINLKVLNDKGEGYASAVIAAIDYAIANRAKFGIKVLNLSLGAAVVQRSADDPLDQAVERAYRSGLIVVAAAGNYGKTSDGRPLFGAITSPGNSPYAITVGALNTKQTVFRSDDVLATYSSKGPTRFDHLVKPDLLAPGNRITSLLAPNASIAQQYPEKVIGSGATRSWSCRDEHGGGGGVWARPRCWCRRWR
jgi:serine protease AprX